MRNEKKMVRDQNRIDAPQTQGGIPRDSGKHTASKQLENNNKYSY